MRRRAMKTVLGLGMIATMLALILAGAGFAGRPVAAQGTTATPNAQPPRHISVSGQGRVTVAPDIATVTVGVETMQPSLAEAQAEATTKMEAIIQTAKDAGIAADDIVTTNYAVNVIQEYDNNGNPAAISGYRVSNQVELTVRQIDDLGTILESVVAEGANAIYGIAFSVDDSTAAASQARRQAVEDARQKADELASAAGVEITGILSITESSSSSGPPEPFQIDSASAGSARDASASVPVQTGTNEIQITVQVVYEIRG